MSAESDLYFGRIYELRLGNKTFSSSGSQGGHDPLDIRFNVVRTSGQTTMKGQVSILGMSMEDMSKFLKLATMEVQKAKSEKIKVQLMAGYEKTGMSCIIDGIAVTASITPPPEMWLHIRVQETGWTTNSIRYYFNDINNPVRLTDVCRHVCSLYGFAFCDKTEDQIGTSKTIGNYGSDKPKTFQEALKELSEKADWTLTSDSHSRQVFAYPKSEHIVPKNDEILMDEKHGLIGVSGISMTNCEIKAFLQVRPSGQGQFGRILLKSKYNTHANGSWNCKEFTQVGHFRGPEWYTVFKCQEPKFVSKK